MKLAILSDVHSDDDALRDAIARIAEMACDWTVCVGDVVDYGLHPEATVTMLRDLVIPTIRGNHDRWAVGTPASIERTGKMLSPDSLAWLRALPVKLDYVLEGVRVAVRHGTPGSDMRGIFPRLAMDSEVRRHLDSVEADALIVGHTHVPFRAAAADGRIIVNAGALLRTPSEMLRNKNLLFDPEIRRLVPGPGNGGGTFGVLELPSKRFTVHRASDGSEIPIPRIG